MSRIREKVDVCVVGAGHAGCEARSNYNNKNIDLEQMHKNNLEKIKDDYEKSVDQINESYRLKKEEYNNIKGNFKPEIKAIREESEEL